MLLALAFSAALAAAQPATSTEVFHPDLFFQGRTQGRGTLRTLTSSRPKPLAVQSTGRIAPDGTLILDQSIMLGGKPSTRTFRLRRADNGGWTGSLTDAGPVTATVTGNRMTLNYRLKNAGRMTQILTLQPDNRTLLNRATVTMMGLRVVTIEETIEKLDP